MRDPGLVCPRAHRSTARENTARDDERACASGSTVLIRLMVCAGEPQPPATTADTPTDGRAREAEGGAGSWEVRTDWPTGSGMSDATRCASDVAAMRRGCVTTMRHGASPAAADARSSSSGISVLLPQPVSPVLTRASPRQPTRPSHAAVRGLRADRVFRARESRGQPTLEAGDTVVLDVLQQLLAMAPYGQSPNLFVGAALDTHARPHLEKNGAVQLAPTQLRGLPRRGRTSSA